MTALVGFGLAAVLSALAWRARWLTAGAAAAATIVGSLVFTGSGLRGASLLGLFVVSASLLTPGRERRRTAPQVIANGLWAGLGGALAGQGLPAGWIVLAASLASAQADTWATEIGTRWGGTPRLITTWRRVPPGSSGAVSALGTMAGIVGALAMAALFLSWSRHFLLAAAVLAGGVAGMSFDSLLGATVQSRYFCDSCGAECENQVHGCGAPARLTRGPSWIDNNAVNFLATGAGAVLALAVSQLV